VKVPQTLFSTTHNNISAKEKQKAGKKKNPRSSFFF
jgi:hypothetical protein